MRIESVRQKLFKVVLIIKLSIILQNLNDMILIDLFLLEIVGAFTIFFLIINNILSHA